MSNLVHLRVFWPFATQECFYNLTSWSWWYFTCISPTQKTKECSQLLMQQCFIDFKCNNDMKSQNFTCWIISFTEGKKYLLKVPGPISQNGDFYSMDASPPKKSWFEISVKSVQRFGHKKRCILQLPIYLIVYA